MSLRATHSSNELVLEDVGAGGTPPVSRLTRIDPKPPEGFACDQMEIHRSARGRDPFCLEYGRPSGLTCQTSTVLDGSGNDVVNVMLFRGPGSGGFDPNDLRSFRAFLPYVRASAMAWRARLQLEADRSAAPFAARGDRVFHVAFDGTVRDCSVASIGALAPDVTMRRGRLMASGSGYQRRGGRALTSALIERKPSLVTIVTDAENSIRLLVPVLGQALDMFDAATALVVALDITRAPRVDERSLDLLASGAGLTRRGNRGRTTRRPRLG